MQSKVAAACLVALLLPPLPSAANPLERGKAKAAQCAACHGPGGIAANPMFPNLAGQNEIYLQMQLDKFRSGDRDHPLMSPVAETLTPEDIADLAAYFSSLDPGRGAGSE